nr:MAG TPA: hypothetical protein [Caudoviricetes sp.]DAW05043.1 MAG TPA: hypothetical protein [Caudoviricetes sp.]
MLPKVALHHRVADSTLYSKVYSAATASGT